MNRHPARRSAAIAGIFALGAFLAVAQSAGQTAAIDVSRLAEIDDDRTDITFEGLSLDLVEEMDVFTPAGEHLGEIEEILGDESGRITAFVVETEHGFLGLREREIVVSVERLTLDKDRGRFTADLTKADIESLPRWKD